MECDPFVLYKKMSKTLNIPNFTKPKKERKKTLNSTISANMQTIFFCLLTQLFQTSMKCGSITMIDQYKYSTYFCLCIMCLGYFYAYVNERVSTCY